MTRRALYVGSFDPPTRGHLWLAMRGLELFDELVVAVGVNPDKGGMLAVERRVELFAAALDDERARVLTFSGRFTVDLARELGATFLLRGIRGVGDLDHERQQRYVNGDLAPEIATVFLMPPRELCEVSSSFVRGLVGLEGWREAVARMVTPEVLAALEETL